MDPAVAYVSVFQNWLKPAGASFDHLHKQLVAIDERGAQNKAVLARLAAGIQIDGEARLQRNCLRYGQASSRAL